MKKLIALYLILLPLWAFAQQTFVPVSATMTDAEGSYTSKTSMHRICNSGITNHP